MARTRDTLPSSTWKRQSTSTDKSVTGLVNAMFVFVTFLLSLPAFFPPTNRGWLRAQGWLVVICATFTLGLGLTVWLDTLQTRRNLSLVWGRQSRLVQSLLQQRASTESQRHHGLGNPDSMGSVIAAAMATQLPHPSSRTASVPTSLSPPKRAAASLPFRRLPTATSIASSPLPLGWWASTSSPSCALPWSSSTG